MLTHVGRRNEPSIPIGGIRRTTMEITSRLNRKLISSSTTRSPLFICNRIPLMNTLYTSVQYRHPDEYCRHSRAFSARRDRLTYKTKCITLLRRKRFSNALLHLYNANTTLAVHHPSSRVAGHSWTCAATISTNVYSLTAKFHRNSSHVHSVYRFKFGFRIYRNINHINWHVTKCCYGSARYMSRIQMENRRFKVYGVAKYWLKTSHQKRQTIN